MPNVFDKFDSPDSSGNVFDQFDDGKRRTPTEMRKIGAEGFADAMRQTLAEATPFARQAAGFGSFPRQLYEGAKQRLGFEDKTAIQGARAMEEAAPASALAGGLATAGLAAFVPGGASVAGQAALGAGTGFLMPADSTSQALAQAGLGGAVGAGGAIALKGLGALAGKLYGSATGKAAQTAAENAERDVTLKLGRDAGYVVPKSATGETTNLEKFVESTSGRGALNREASKRNQLITNKIAREEAGLKPNERINETNLEKAREAIAEPYRQVAALSPKAEKALRDMKEARAMAKKYHEEHQVQKTVSSSEKADKFDAKALAAEKIIEQEAVKVTMGQGALAEDLLARLRDARVRLAKNFDVERAMVPGSGDVDAHVIGNMLDKRGEKAVTGGLQVVGKMAKTFPDFTRQKPSGQLSAAISAVRPYATALALGYGAQDERAHRFGVSPYMLAAAGISAAGGPARRLALSKFAQTAPEYAPGMASRAANYLTNDPRMRSVIPLASVAGVLHPNDQ